MTTPSVEIVIVLDSIDPDALAVEWACIGSGIRGSKLFIPGTSFLDLPDAEAVDGLAR